MKKLLFCCLTILGLVVLVNSCKKPPTTVVTPTPVGLASNLHIVDTTQWKLSMANGTINMGYYDYSFTQSTPYINVQVGDILLGATGQGYLRKVISVSLSGSTLNLRTVTATMADVFKGGNFSFDMDLSGMNNSAVGFYDTFNNVYFSHTGATEFLRLTSGSISMNPTWHFNFAFDTNGLTNFAVSTKNAGFSVNHTLDFVTNTQVSFTKEMPIGDFTKTSVQWVTVGGVQVPVVVTLEVSLTATAVGWANGGGVSSQETFASTGSFNQGLQFAGGAWQSNFDITPSSGIAATPATPGIGATDHGNVTIVPKVNVKLYGTTAAYAQVGMDGSVNTVYAPGGNWNFFANGWFNSGVTAYAGIWGPKVPAYISQAWSGDTISYQTPFAATKNSGDAQTAAVLTVLPNKLVVKVLDSNGNPQAKVPVSFTPATSCGSVSPASVSTDANGLASTTWTLGTVHGSQSVTVKIKDGHSNYLNGTPTSFTATGQ